MKVLAIAGSPRGAKSRTMQMVEAVAQGAREAGAETEVVDICKLQIKYCTGCAGCYATGKCGHKDDFTALHARILACDGLVIGSPNYFRGVTAQLKTMFDRMADTVHCQLLTGKYACAVATAGGPAHHEVTDYLSAILIGFGANLVGSVGASASAPGAIEAALTQAIALGAKLVGAIRAKPVYPEQETIHKATRERFRQLVNMNKELWPHEYEHWRRVGA